MPSKKLNAFIKRRKHKKVQKKEKFSIENEFRKLNLIKEIFSSEFTNKFIKIINDKKINLALADNLILSSI